ncbi:MAG: o-succinylbenzoate synthase [Muribaculaceae bacterium]|nr:o-succinylbenzoate synthase [Muribaculaceae bacterium]
MRFAYAPYRLVFKQPAGTSRGVLHEKATYFVRISEADNPAHAGYGEVPFFEGLSSESETELIACLQRLLSCTTLEELQYPGNTVSSLTFGLEQALAQYQRPDSLIFPSSFTEGMRQIRINGLIWMGNREEMRQRIIEKLAAGFHCIKVKIGAIDWQSELSLLNLLRCEGGEGLTIRVDANGGFDESNCMSRLEDLAALGVHSIEQPVRAGQTRLMAEICRESPVPVALDEELIGILPGERRAELLSAIKPQYIILKPALCYGFSGALDWIARAGQLGIGYWITSALESSVGLTAIAEFTGTLGLEGPQGLGTGSLYTNNFASPLSLDGECLTYSGPADIYYNDLKKLPWIER